MRAISQNGKFDLPYENLAIFVEYENVIARFENERYLLAQYSSEAKAIKAMEMLRTKYRKFQEITSENGRYFAFNYPKVFQFPQDSEV
jgi:hypothetical protein|nr:MAG TPA: hypothetical protein [Caudoviricetes sp.]